MDSVMRGVAVYVSLLIILKFAGRRTLSEMTNLDFALLLMIGEATQQALLGEDFSVTNAILVILTLIMMDIGISLMKLKAPKVEKWLEGVPLIVVSDGNPLRELMRRARVDEEDILTAARKTQGLERMEQIEYAVLECNGGISIIPK